jgi:hypothetical protein
MTFKQLIGRKVFISQSFGKYHFSIAASSPPVTVYSAHQ